MKRRDSIVEELHKVRERIGRANDFDADRIALTIRRHEEERGRGDVGAAPRRAILGEYIGSEIFDVALETSAAPPPDFYLVLAGIESPAGSSRGDDRPWRIEAVYLFDARTLVDALRQRGRKIGEATSVVKELWAQSQIFPEQHNSFLVLDQFQTKRVIVVRSSQAGRHRAGAVGAAAIASAAAQRGSLVIFHHGTRAPHSAPRTRHQAPSTSPSLTPIGQLNEHSFSHGHRRRSPHAIDSTDGRTTRRQARRHPARGD